MSSTISTLELGSDISDVRRARRWVAERLETMAALDEELIDTVVLLTSELVTNSLLYAAPPVQVALRATGPRIRLEVCDGSPTLPVAKDFGALALTGRGLGLVAILATAWGIEATDQGKAVWFELDEAGPADHPVEAQISPAAAAAVASAGADLAGADPTGADTRRVRIVDLPLAVYLVSEAQNDALLREFALISRDPLAPAVPARLLALVEEVQDRLGPQVESSRAQINSALERGEERITLDLEMPVASREVVRRIVELLEEADRFCREGDLLTLTSPPEVVRFREWYLGQVLHQLDGGPPTPWISTPTPTDAGDGRTP